MTPALETALVATISGAFELWRIHANKPEGWRPTSRDVDNLMRLVDEATPEAEKEAARKRLGI